LRTMAAGISGATCAVRLRQLQALRERQAAKESRLEAEVVAEASELQELQQSNARNAEAAERELVELTTTLQRSLRCEDELVARVHDEEVAAAQASERKAKASADRDATIAALRQAEEEFRQWDAALWEEKAQKERFLQELHEQRQAASAYEERAAAAAAARIALEFEVAGLRREAVRFEHRELASRRILAGQNQRRLRGGFHGLAIGSQLLRGERKRRNLFEKRWFAVHGFDVFATWRWHSSVRARLREANAKVVRSMVVIFLHAWAVYVSDYRWIVRQSPASLMFRQRWLIHRALKLWSHNVKTLISSQRGLAVRRFGLLILRSWHEESSAAWWTRRVQVYYGRWRQRFLLRRCCREWSCRTHTMRRVHRKIERLECRSRLIRTRTAFQSWSACKELHAYVTERFARQQRKLLLSHLLTWRQCASQQRALTRVQCRRHRRLLHAAFVGLSDYVARMHSAHRLARASHCCGNAWSLQISAFNWWFKAAAPRRGMRLMAAKSLRARLQSWKRWSQGMQVIRLRARMTETARSSLAVYTRRLRLASWASSTRISRAHKARALTVRNRQSCVLCRKLWHVWLSHWKSCIREQCSRLKEKVREASAEQESMKDELGAMRRQRGCDELVRLSIVDELQRVCAEVAELSVDLESVRAVTVSLEETAACEREISDRRRDEASAIRAQRALIGAHHAEECTLLEKRFREALTAPAMLRSELRDCEEQTAAAEAAGVEAKRVSAMLQSELESLHATVPVCIRERSNQVAEFRDRVMEARCVANALEEELTQQQSVQQIRDAALEERRRNDTDREISLFRTTHL